MAEDSITITLKPEDLETIAGGFDVNKLNDEDRRRYNELAKALWSELGDDWKSDKSSAAWQKMQDFIKEMEKKYQ